MSNISANSLFHFTPKLEYLIEIFRRGFQPRYCFENLKLNDTRSMRGYNMGIPMTCFCDISLSQIGNHVNTYGNYGIGMKKEWGIKKRLNPIIYLNKDSFVAEPFSVILENGFELNKIQNDTVRKIGSDVLNSVASLLMYSKPCSGSFTHREQTKSVKFYNEREWRFIPTKNNKPAPFGTLSKEKMLDPEELKRANNKLKNYRLLFDTDDVKYIFVKEESEIHKIVNKLREIKSEDYDNQTINILTSKILTTKQISEDF